MEIKNIKKHFNVPISFRLRELMRDIKIDSKNKKRLKNTNPTIVSINCNGGTIAHDLGLRHNSQFVNLWLFSKDFIKYLSNFDYYNSLPLVFIESSEYDYPVGMVGDIAIHFTHYSTNEEAQIKWDERKIRIDKNNMFIMMTDKCAKEDMEAFDLLPYENKVIFTHMPYNDIKSSFYIKGFEQEESVGILSNYISKKSIYKWYDQFDYVEWFNTGKIRRMETR